MQTEHISRRLFLLACVCNSTAFLLGCEEGDIRKAAVKLVPEEELRQMGIETWRRIRSQTQPSRDVTLQKKLQTIGERIAKASSSPGGDWEFVVFRGDQINAFVVPGNKVGFFEGMFAAARNDSQIAAVLGHEIGHINAQHHAERVATAFAKQVGVTVVLAALRAGDVQYANEIAGLLGAGLEYGVILPYSRRQEHEADRLGVEYMVRAGYAAGEAVAFWHNMMAINRDRPRPLPFLSTHPSDQERIAALREVVQQVAAR